MICICSSEICKLFSEHFAVNYFANKQSSSRTSADVPLFCSFANITSPLALVRV